MKINLKLFYLITLISVTVLFISSCSQSDSVQQKETINEDSIFQAEVLSDLINQADIEEDYSFLLPSPLQVSYLFKRYGLKYNPLLANDTENASKYRTNLGKLLGLGVYSADLPYCILNEDLTKATDYLNTVKKLSIDLGFNQDENKQLGERFEKNLNNLDSLLELTASIKEQMDAQMENSNQKYKVYVIFVGTYIEGMHFCLNELKNVPNERLERVALQQMSILGDIIKGLVHYPNKDKSFNNLLYTLCTLNDIYDNFAFNQIEDSKSEEEVDPKMTVEELNSYLIKTEEIRDQIINGKY